MAVLYFESLIFIGGLSCGFSLLPMNAHSFKLVVREKWSIAFISLLGHSFAGVEKFYMSN